MQFYLDSRTSISSFESESYEAIVILNSYLILLLFAFTISSEFTQLCEYQNLAVIMPLLTVVSLVAFNSSEYAHKGLNWLRFFEKPVPKFLV